MLIFLFHSWFLVLFLYYKSISSSPLSGKPNSGSASSLFFCPSCRNFPSSYTRSSESFETFHRCDAHLSAFSLCTHEWMKWLRRSRLIQDRLMCLPSRHKLLNPLLPRKRFSWKILAAKANYLLSISLLKTNLPPAAWTNLCFCVHNWMPLRMSWGECVYYLCVRPL